MERTKQSGLNELVAKRIAEKLARGGTNVQEATSRLIAEGKMSRDFLFEVGSVRKGKEPAIQFMPDNHGKVGGTFKMPTGQEDFTFNPYAVRQVAEKMRIPTAYLTGLLFGSEWERNLGYEIMNTHNSWMERSNILVRAIGSEVRAVLSDSYRILDSEMIFGTHMDEIFANGAQLSDGFMDDTKFMIESLMPFPIEIVTPLNGNILVAFGQRWKSSDYGAGKLEGRSFILQGICLNGLVTEQAMKEIHLGGRLENNQGILSRKTIELDSAATASAVRDITKHLYSSPVIKDKMLMIEASASTVVDPVQVLSSYKDIGKLLKGEVEAIGQLIMRNEASKGIQGESTLWKISQGITAYANDVEDVTKRMELQEIAGELFKKVGKN
jgi:hypothetical protein